MQTIQTAAERNGLTVAPRSVGDLCLRVREAGRREQILRIYAPRCTIGGSPSCTVRLRAFGVHPLHCLVRQDNGQAIVRSLSADNLLNGRPFYEARLHSGDLLTLGPLTFEVQGDRAECPGDSERQTANPLAPVDADPSRGTPGGSAASPAVVSRVERLEQQLAEIERRSPTPVAGETPSPRDSCQSFSALEQFIAQLTEERERRSSDRSQWEQEKQNLEDELADQSRRLAEAESQRVEAVRFLGQLNVAYEQTRERLQKLDELEATCEQLRTRLRELEPLEVAYHRSRERVQELEETEVAYEQARMRLRELEVAVERERRARESDEERHRLAENAWAALRNQLAEQRDQQQAQLFQLEQRAAELEAAAGYIENGEDQTSDREPSSDDSGCPSESVVEEDTATAEAEEQVADALERLGQLGIWREDDVAARSEVPESAVEVPWEPAEEDPLAAEPQRGPEEFPAALADTPPGGSPADEEDSIENYMNRLLHRLRGADPEHVRPLPVEDRRPPMTEVVWEAPPAPASPAAVPVPVEPVEYRPRSQAPELAVSLAAMRAVANDSTRSAIVTHRQRSSYQRSLTRMLGSLLLLLGAGVVTFHFRGNGIWANLGLATSLCAGGFGLWQLVSFRRRVLGLFANEAPSEDLPPPTASAHDDGSNRAGEDDDFPAHEAVPRWPVLADSWDKPSSGA